MRRGNGEGVGAPAASGGRLCEGARGILAPADAGICVGRGGNSVVAEEQPEPQRRHAEEEGAVARVDPVVEEDGAVGERRGDEPGPVVGAVGAGDDTGRRARG